MKPSSRWHDVYEIDPQRASIPAHSFVYATVIFTPPSMQVYNATLEAAVDGMPSAMSKYRNLTFDIQGEGNLPRITIVRPTARNKKGAPVLLFRRLLLGRSQVCKCDFFPCEEFLIIFIVEMDLHFFNVSPISLLSSSPPLRQASLQITVTIGDRPSDNMRAFFLNDKI